MNTIMASCNAGSADCNFTCPKGGTWFVCTSEPYFVGCCASDPCTNTTTPACPDIYPASFNSSIYDKISPNDCIDGSSTDWYTCNFTSPTFLGCCSSNPCGDGCPSGDLLPAAWSSSAAGQLHLFLDGASPSSTTATSSSSTTTSTSASTSTKSSITTSNNTDSQTSIPSAKSLSLALSSGAIAGIAIAVALVLSTIIAIVFFRRRQRRHRQPSAADIGEGIAMGESGAKENFFAPYGDLQIGNLDPNIKNASHYSAAYTVSSSSPLLSEAHGPQISELDTSNRISELDSAELKKAHELEGQSR